MIIVRDPSGNNRFIARGDTPPMTLGKFLDAKAAFASICQVTVRFTPPNQLNDKWDCIPFRYRREDIECLWQHSILSRLCPEQKQYFIEQYANRDWSPLREQLSNIIGVASFADLNHCDLSWMWNRYGDYHKGCLIVFDTSKMGLFFKVEYLAKRPEVSIPLDEDTYPPVEVLTVFTVKERGTIDHWEKECEWRMIDHLSHLDLTETEKGPIYVRSYPKSFFKVICGHCMDWTIFNEITEVAISKGILVEREKV